MNILLILYIFWTNELKMIIHDHMLYYLKFNIDIKFAFFFKYNQIAIYIIN